MREFMTRVSDYLSERREDPERREDRLSLAVIAAVAAVVVVLLLLVWWGYTTHENKEKAAAEKAKELQEAQDLVATAYEEKMEEYMSQNAGEELRQESLVDTGALAEKVRELQQTMETVEKELTKVVTERVERDSSQKETLASLESAVKNAAETISRMEGRLTDLHTAMQTIDKEKLPLLQSQVKEIRTEVEQARTAVSGIRESVAALKTEDEKLWKELSAVEKNLQKAAEQNMRDIDSQLDKVSDHIDRLEEDMKTALRQVEKLEETNKKLENRVDAISEGALSYRYEQGTNTLYLTPASGRFGR